MINKITITVESDDCARVYRKISFEKFILICKKDKLLKSMIRDLLKKPRGYGADFLVKEY